MDAVAPALTLAGAVALLLWGSHMVQSGVQRAFGPRLRIYLGHALPNRVAALLAGMGVTVLLQSSTATGLMATSLAAADIVGLVPALAIMLGANIGTALIVQVLAFDIVLASPLLLIGGLLLFRRGRSALLHDLGRVLIGLGLMLIALHQMLEVIAPLQQSADVKTLLGLLGGLPLLALAAGAVAAWAAHSSVVVVLLVVSLATHGLVGLEPTLMLVLGANLGTTLNPMLEGTAGADRSSRRLPLGNLLNRIVGVLLAWMLVGPIAGGLTSLGLAPGSAAALFHLLFNIVMAALALPFLTPIARGLQRLLPDPPTPADPRQPAYLDPTARETPVVALGGAAREALRLADTLEQMLVGARDALDSGDRRVIANVRELDDVLDSLNHAINTYLIGLDAEELSEADRQRRSHILAFSMNLEQAGDVIDRVLLPHGLKRLRRGIAISDGEALELRRRMEQLIANLRKAATLLVTDDPRAARQLVLEKLEFRRVEREAISRHLSSLREGADAPGTAIVLDLLRDMKVINSFIVAAAAYPVLDNAGELLPSRLSDG